MTSEERARLTPQQTSRGLTRQERLEQDWVKRIDLNGKVTGVFADYHYVGTGDIGGATQESTVKLLEAIVDEERDGASVAARAQLSAMGDGSDS